MTCTAAGTFLIAAWFEARDRLSKLAADCCLQEMCVSCMLLVVLLLLLLLLQGLSG